MQPLRQRQLRAQCCINHIGPAVKRRPLADARKRQTAARRSFLPISREPTQAAAVQSRTKLALLAHMIAPRTIRPASNSNAEKSCIAHTKCHSRQSRCAD
ncbi:hypothetical protein PF002_g10741 [Phytophthora fragariae]|uniref:Uncharacterized protein n=1 Tax=Phytophthora fragariae TaxID=53985 RepID=A0A6A4DT25_9STRA|nr:hypothetical protein PF004_g8478 [Phytophthora fragariae]KAE9238118.1 hypothetical protein PF002_g10741 [Phytophthora fragariae]KAE9313802.1 hypothetical protein PF001_g8572 [Phytophthora fragariae]